MHHAYAEQKRPWTLDDVNALRLLVEERIEPAMMAVKLKRSEADVRAKAAEIGRAIRSTGDGQRH